MVEVKQALEKNEILLQDSDFALYQVLKELVKAINRLSMKMDVK